MAITDTKNIYASIATSFTEVDQNLASALNQKRDKPSTNAAFLQYAQQKQRSAPPPVAPPPPAANRPLDGSFGDIQSAGDATKWILGELQRIANLTKEDIVKPGLGGWQLQAGRAFPGGDLPNMKRYKQMRAAGKSDTEAKRIVFEETSLPSKKGPTLPLIGPTSIGLKGLAEMTADPLNLLPGIGMVPYGKVAKAAVLAAKQSVKAGEKVGTRLGQAAVEARVSEAGALNVGKGGIEDVVVGKPVVSSRKRTIGKDISVRVRVGEDIELYAHNTTDQVKIGVPPQAKDPVWSVYHSQLSGVTGERTETLLQTGLTKADAISYAKSYSAKVTPPDTGIGKVTTPMTKVPKKPVVPDMTKWTDEQIRVAAIDGLLSQGRKVSQEAAQFYEKQTGKALGKESVVQPLLGKVVPKVAKPVPPEVLKDYPDLIKPTAKALPVEAPVKPLPGVVGPPPLPPKLPLVPQVAGSIPPKVPPPAVGTAGIPPVPPKSPTADGWLLDDLQNTDEIVQTMSNPDYFRKIAALPGVRSVMKYLNPAGVAKTVAEKGVVARAALRAEADNKVIGAFSTLEQLGSREKVWGKINELGQLTEGPLTGKPLDEVLTYRQKFTPQLTSEQQRWAGQFHNLEVAKKSLLERNGIDINELSFEEGGEYVSRRVVGKTDTEGTLVASGFVGSPGPGRPGMKMGAEKVRVFKDINEAIAKGYRYLPPDEALFLNIKGAYNRVADKQTADWIMELVPYRTTEVLSLPKATALVSDAMKGAAIPESRLVALRRDMPEFAEKIEVALNEKDWPSKYRQLKAIQVALRQIIPTAEAKLWWMTERLTKQRQTAQNAVAVMERALRGETIPTGTIKAIENVVPQLKDKLRESTRITLQDLVRSGKEAAEWPKILEVPHPGVLAKYKKLLADAERELAANPNDAGLVRNVRQLRTRIGFTKYRIAQGEPIELSKSPVSILTQEHKVALQDALDVLRGIKYDAVTATGTKTVKFRGGIIKELREKELKAIQLRTLISERASTTSLGEARVNAPAFAGKILTGPEAQETAEVLNKAFTTQYGPLDNILTSVNKVNAITRFFALAGDASPMLIQLITFPFRFPKQYGQSAINFTKALFSEEAHAAYLAANNDVIQKSRNIILSHGGQTEYTEAFRRGGLLASNKLPGKILHPFQRGFEAALDTAGIELRKAFDYMADTPQHTAEIEQFINEIRGVTSSSRLGVSQQIRSAETAVLLAPRYNRAIAALLTDVVRGGIRGDQARKAMVALTGGMTALGTAITLANDEGWDRVTDHLDPRSPDFMTWNIAGQRVGPGSKIRSVLRLMGRIEAEPLKTIDFASDFVRGNFSPMLGTGVDVISGRNFVGQPTRPGENVDFGEGMLGLTKTVVAENLLPIWVQSVAMGGGDIEGRAVRGSVEFFGARSSPITTVSSSFQWQWKDDLKFYNAIPANDVERKGKLNAATTPDERLQNRYSRTEYRKRNPAIEAKLFVAGQVSTISTRNARTYTWQLIQKYKIDPNTITGIQKNKTDTAAKLKAGVRDTVTTDTDKLVRSLQQLKLLK